MTQKEKRETIIKAIFSSMNFLSAGILIVVASIAIFLFKHEVNKATSGLIVGILGAAIMFAIMAILDRNKQFSALFQKGNYNFRWVFIMLISVSFTIIAGIIYVILADIKITFTSIELTAAYNSENNMQLILFLIGSIIGMISGQLIFFGIKNFNPKVKIEKSKFTIFAALSVILLIGSSVGLYAFNTATTFPEPEISSGTGYNDGPWLTWEEDPTSTITISWFTAEKNNSVVYYGTTPGILDQSYSKDENVYLHHAKISNLESDTQYFYTIPEDFEEDHISDIYNFTTAPTSSESRAFKFGIFGDVQPYNMEYVAQNKKVVDALIQQDFDFMMHTGDLSDSGTDNYEWHLAMLNFARMGANHPIQGAIGNHDWDGKAGSSNWDAIFPYPYENPNLGRHYSFDYLSAHCVLIDNFEKFYMMTDEQLEWIESDITEARTKDPDCWVFCLFHLSMMTTATSGHFYELQQELVPLFDKLNVDAVFFGHDHHYEHYNYTYGETGNGYLFDEDHEWDHNEVQYFCTGGGGANLETAYGVLESEKVDGTDTVTWFDPSQEKYVEIEYEKTAWNAENYVTHDAFSVNYTTGGIHEGKYYYHDPAVESYNEYAEEIGFDYGEQCYQYMQVEINADGSECTISARYPNGELISGPGDSKPQTWTFVR